MERLAGGGGCALDSSVDGSSRYLWGGGAGDKRGDDVFVRREGFLLGIGGGAGLRRTCALLLPLEGWPCGKLEARYGKLGKE